VVLYYSNWNKAGGSYPNWMKMFLWARSWMELLFFV